MNALDIRPGDIIRVMGRCGATYIKAGTEVPQNLLLRVLATGAWPLEPDRMRVYGRLLRSDLADRSGQPHSGVTLHGPHRSILNLGGMWQLVERDGQRI